MERQRMSFVRMSGIYLLLAFWVCGKDVDWGEGCLVCMCACVKHSNHSPCSNF